MLSIRQLNLKEGHGSWKFEDHCAKHW